MQETNPENRLLDLEELWHTSDSEVPLHEFLLLSKAEYASFIEGALSEEEVMNLYDARSNGTE
jgi:hypothetical protein